MRFSNYIFSAFLAATPALTLLVLPTRSAEAQLSVRGASLPPPGLQQAIDLWNATYGVPSDNTITGYEIVGPVLDLTHAAQVADDIALGWTANGDLGDPSGFEVVEIGQNLEVIPAQALFHWISFIRSRVAPGDVIFELILELPDGACVRPVGVLDPTQMRVRIDSFFPNVLFEAPTSSPDTEVTTTCHTKRWAWLIFGGTRARFESKITAGCSSTGSVRYCDKDCSGFMNLGSLDFECVKEKKQPCCVLHSAYAIKTATGSANVNAQFGQQGNFIKFDFSFSGLGSQFRGEKDCRACCQ